MEKKKKNLGASRLKSIPFLLIWTVAHAIVWVMLYQVAEHGPDSLSMIIQVGLIMGVGLALMQKFVIQYTYRDTLKWWLIVTIIGWVLAWISFDFYFDRIGNLHANLDDNLGVMLMPLFVIPAAMQWFILRHNTRHAWLWIVAGAVSAMAFGTLYDSVRADEFWQFIAGASAQGAVTGLSLLWLYGQSRVEKGKVDTSATVA